MTKRKSSQRPWRIENAGDATVVVDATGAVIARIVVKDGMTREASQEMAMKLIEAAERLETSTTQKQRSRTQ